MTALEHCESAENGLAAAQKFLREPHPEKIDQGLEALSRVLEILEKLAAGRSTDWDPAVHLAFHRIRAGALNLQRQIEHGANLVRGWMQRKYGAGYTQTGLPQFADHDGESVLEA